ncbi:LlsX family protein [Listeria welshimeri]|nr:LlsX family protein [Listeria welshimeri]
MKKKFNNPTIRIITSIVLGIIIGFLICFVAISMGYNQMNDATLTDYSVKVFGLPIFDIQRVGSDLVGTPNNSSMMFIGVIFSMILAIVIEIVVSLKNKHRKEGAK